MDIDGQKARPLIYIMREQCYLDLKVMYKYTKVDVDIADRNWTSKTPTQPLSSLS